MSSRNTTRLRSETYVDNLTRRIDHLQTFLTQGYEEETLILACSYLHGLARDRVAVSIGSDDAHRFTQLLRQYGGHSHIFDRVSRTAIVHRTPNDPFAPKALHQHTVVVTAILARFGIDTNVENDPTEAELLDVLSGIPRLNEEHLRATLWRYTLGAVLHRQWQNVGRSGNSCLCETKELHGQGEHFGVRYHEDGYLQWSPFIIVDTMRHILTTLQERGPEDETTLGQDGKPST